MAITSWPYVAQDTTDIEYSRLYREAVDDGVVGSLGDNNLKVTGDSSGMQVKMATGQAIARGYMMYSTAIETITGFTAAHASLARIDRIVLELNLSAPTVPQRLVPKIVTGTAGSGNPAALVQTDTGIYQIPMARVNVGAGVTTISAGSVTDDRDWIGQSVGAWMSDAKRPSSPRKYKIGYNEAQGYFEYWTGSAWSPLVGMALTSSALTGVLPISKGGTGANAWLAAREALNIYTTATEPAYLAGRIWVKAA